MKLTSARYSNIEKAFRIHAGSKVYEYAPDGWRESNLKNKPDVVFFSYDHTGDYKKGDIVWNDSPKETGYVGWVCIRTGNPGIWRGFGQIGVE